MPPLCELTFGEIFCSNGEKFCSVEHIDAHGCICLVVVLALGGVGIAVVVDVLAVTVVVVEVFPGLVGSAAVPSCALPPEDSTRTIIAILYDAYDVP